MATSPLAEKQPYSIVGPWRLDEDRRLTDYIQSHAGSLWSDVPQAAGLVRSVKSCYLQWLNLLIPATVNLTHAELVLAVKLSTDLHERNTVFYRSEMSTFNGVMYLLNDYTDDIVPPLSIKFNPLTYSGWMGEKEKERQTSRDEIIFLNKNQRSMTFEDILYSVAELIDERNQRDATCIEQNDTNVGQLNSITIPPTPQDDFHSKNKGVIQVDSSENNDTTPNDSDFDDDDQNNNKTSLDTTHISKTPGYITSKICFSLEVLEQHFDKNMEDAAKSLNVSRSSLKRMCRANGINRWPCRKRKINHQQLDNPKTVNKLVQKNNNQTNQSTRTQAEIISPSGNASSSSNVIIKATYGDDIIKFRLSVSSGVDELREKIGKRLELEVRSFKLKYRDDAGDLVLITCDEDLHDCLGNSRLSTSIDNKTTFDILVINNSG